MVASYGKCCSQGCGKMRSRRTNFLDLPEEILLNITEYLPLASIQNIRPTCSRLNKISHSREIMKRQKFVIKSAHQMESCLEMLTAMGISHLNLEFININNLADSAVFNQFLRLHGSKIDSLRIRFCDINQDFIENVMFNSVSLKELILEGFETLNWPRKTHTSQALNTTLKTLKIRYDSCIHPDVIDSILNFYPKIEELNIFCIRWEDTSIADLVANKLATHNTCIEKLCLRIKAENRCCEALIRSDLRMQNLKELELNWGINFTTDGLKRLLSQCSQLESLKLHGTADSWVSVPQLMQVTNTYAKNLKILKCPTDLFDETENARILNLTILYESESKNSYLNYTAEIRRKYQCLRTKGVEFHLIEDS